MASLQEFLSSLAGLGPQGDTDRFNALLEQAASHAKAGPPAPDGAGDDHPLHGGRLICTPALTAPTEESTPPGAAGAGGLSSNRRPDCGATISEEETLRRKRVWDWFGGLTIDERDRVFTVVDKSWISLLLTMHAEVKRKGDGVFYFEESEMMVAPVKGKRSTVPGCVVGEGGMGGGGE